MTKRDKRRILKVILAAEIEALKEKHTFYLNLEEKIPIEETWRIMQLPKLIPETNGLLEGHSKVPSSELKIAIKTFEEYLSAIETMSDTEFTAFLMGMGFNGIDFPYWGRELLINWIERMKKKKKFYVDLQKKVSKAEKWRLEIPHPLRNIAPLFYSRNDVLPTVALDELIKIGEMYLDFLIDRKF